MLKQNKNPDKLLEDLAQTQQQMWESTRSLMRTQYGTPKDRRRAINATKRYLEALQELDRRVSRRIAAPKLQKQKRAVARVKKRRRSIFVKGIGETRKPGSHKS